MFFGQIERLGALGVGEHEAIIADRHLDDIGDIVGVTQVPLRALHAARGVGDVWEVLADALAEQLEAGA